MRIATRKSALALWQSEFIKAKLEEKYNYKVELIGLKTKGDVILDSPLSKIGGKGLFTKELEIQMLEGNAEIAVHSLKDVPVVFDDGLILGAISKRADVRDCFVSQNYDDFSKLPKCAKVGTTSLRRAMQLKILRKDLVILSLRGNVNTRLNKLKNGEFDAIILAKAGIDRLNLNDEIKFVKPFSLDEMIPAMGQGALGIECLDKKEILDEISFLNDENSIIETTIERDFVTKLNGGCQVPIGVNAQIIGDKIKIRAIVGTPDGEEFIKEEKEISKSDYKNFGKILADEFIQKGAKEILAKAEILAKNFV